MTTVVRVKRHRLEDPASALVVACKRLKLLQTDGGESGGQDNNNDVPAIIEEEKNLFNFAGTVESKNEPIIHVVKKALAQSVIANRNPRARIIDIHGKLRSEYKKISGKNRLKLTNIHRGIDLTDENVTSKSPEIDILYNLFDIIDENTEATVEDKIQVTKTEDIACNGVPMIRHYKHKEERPTDADYVYDLYMTRGVDFDDCVLQQSVSVEKYSLDPSVRFPNEEFEKDDTEDEDSNDENYYKNDYPEEDSDFEKDIDYWCDHDHESLVEQLTLCNLGDVDESYLDDDHPSEEDIWTLGPAYALYKARTLNEL